MGDPVTVGEGSDPEFGIAWTLVLSNSHVPGQQMLRLNVEGGGGGGGTTIVRRGAPLNASRSYGITDRKRGIAHLTGAVGKQFGSVYAEFDDGSTKEATMVSAHDLPVQFYVLFVDRRPARLVGTDVLGHGGEWVNDPLGRVPCGKADSA